MHELEPHTQCSCGRYFTERALSAHMGYVMARRIAHRPFDADPSTIGHDPYRAACDSLLKWASELNEEAPEAKLEGSYVAGRILALIASELISRPADEESA